jgi:CspA family cold shock protein
VARRAVYSYEANEVTTGTVKWFNPTKGFGFIQPDNGGPDAFVHISAVERAGLQNLNEGQRVKFDLIAGRNGKSSAENLTLAA